jgi:hypothetical protein
VRRSNPNVTHDEYLDIVERAKEYIRAGDIFQVVPSQRFAGRSRCRPSALYRALRRLNPSPFLYHLAFPGFTIVGSSPEILVRLRDGTVTIRPIAGTRRRGATPEDDARLAEELMADPKERAEHLMLLDLGPQRCRPRGGNRHRQSHGQLLHRALFACDASGLECRRQIAQRARCDRCAGGGLPAGTLSGAPKIRAMEIIDEFEKEKRGAAYAGAVGYFAANGAMDTCIVLRTAVVKDGMMYVQAGGGVVADSDPQAEYEESVNKAKALMAAAEEAMRYASSAKRGQCNYRVRFSIEWRCSRGSTKPRAAACFVHASSAASVTAWGWPMPMATPCSRARASSAAICRSIAPDRLFVIEEHIAARARHTEGARERHDHRAHRRARIQKEHMLVRQRLDDRHERRAIGCEPAPHVIVDAAVARHA